jgi:hypothetical protein
MLVFVAITIFAVIILIGSFVFGHDHDISHDVGHEDCKYFEEVKNRFTFFASKLLSLNDHQKKVLSQIPKAIVGILAGKVSIETYFAKFNNPEKTQIVFEKVEL